jgi:hypothetical protein
MIHNDCESLVYLHLTVGSPNSSISQVGFVLESTVSGGFVPYSYLWSTFASTTDITISSVGLYWLIVTDSLSCPIDTAYYEVTVLHTSVAELGIDNFSIYPNPSRDVFNIEFTSYKRQSLVVRVVNILGEQILEDRLDNFAGDYIQSINLENYSKGSYFLEIETDDGVINKKLILQ